MKHAKTLAISVAVVVVTSAIALVMNIGILQATAGSDGNDGAGEWAAEPTVLAIEAGALPSNATSTSAAAAERSAPSPTAAPATAAPATAAPSTAAPSTAAPSTAAPSTAAPTTAPSTTAPESTTTVTDEPASTTTYHTYTVGSAGEVVIANHGSSLEFWAAYPAPGWEYGVEDAIGREIKVKFRGNGEIEWKAQLEDSGIEIEMEN